MFSSFPSLNIALFNYIKGGKGDNNMTVEEMVALINSDNKKGLETVRGIANSGNANAQLLVGILYQMGAGGEEHLSDAAYYFRMAAEQGVASAQTNLGKCYLAGDGVSKDDIKAFEWFEKAAKQGDAEGQYQLGRCFEEGWGTEKIENLAFQYYNKSASQGYAKAQIQVGFCYLDGIGVAANNNGAFEWFKKAAEQDDPDGQYLVGACYADGTGVIKNSNEAVKWYRKAAEQGIAAAQHNLGICYLEGDGVPQNRSEARKLFQKAAEQGYEDAKKALQFIDQQANQNSNDNNNLNRDESTIINNGGNIEDSATKNMINEDSNKGEADKLRNELVSQSHQIGRVIWVFMVVLGAIVSATFFPSRDLYPEDDAGEIILDIIRGAAFGFVIGMAIYERFDWPKREQQKIKQWKKDNPNDPRCKYL